MRVFSILFSVITFFCCQIHALDVTLDVYRYYDPTSMRHYLENYIRVSSNSVTYTGQKGAQNASVNIILTVEQGTEIVAFEKYTLNSPVSAEPKDFLDLKRFGLVAGSYIIHLEAVDANDTANKIEMKQAIVIDEVSMTDYLSDVMVLGTLENTKDGVQSNFIKHGLTMEPASYGFLGDDVSTIRAFTELYNPSQGGYIKYSIVEGFQTGEGEEVIAKYKKNVAETVVPLVMYLPIDELTSGNYHFKVEAFDKEKKLLSNTSEDFIRRNKQYDVEYWSNFDKKVNESFVDSIATKDLRYHLLSLIPVAKEPHLSSLDVVLDLENENAQRQFLLNYWKDQSPKYPQLAHGKYMKVVDLVHDLYDNNVGFGFQTDRGHIFLKYGKPNDVISIENEPDAPPYEIWYYHQLDVTRQTNVRFLFYNPSLSHNDYQLLHSSCIGERNNPAWEVELYRDAPESQIGATIEATEVRDGWNRRAKEYFNDF